MLTCQFFGLPDLANGIAESCRDRTLHAGAVVTVVKKKGADKLLPLTAPRLRAEALRN